MINSKKISLVILIVVVAALAAGAFLLFKKPQSRTAPPVSVGASALVSEKTAGKYYTMNLSYPQSGPTRYPEIFNFVAQSKSDFLSQFGNISDSDAATLGLGGDQKYEYDMTTRIATSTKTVSYIIEVYEFTGGAHGNTDVATFTYDKSGKLVTLDDFFAAPYLDRVAGLSRTYFYGTLGDYAEPEMIDAGTEATTTNFSAWYLTDQNITFIFGQYQVGPYVIGMPEFSIARSALSDIISQKYK
jgi:hypothetical protein